MFVNMGLLFLSGLALDKTKYPLKANFRQYEIHFLM